MAGYDVRIHAALLVDPRFADLSDAAVALFVKANMWSVLNLSDGQVPRSACRFLHPTGQVARETVDELVAAGMVTTSDGTMNITDFADSQMTSQKHRERLERNRSYSKAYRRRHGIGDDDPVDNHENVSSESVPEPRIGKAKDSDREGQVRTGEPKPAKCRSCGHLELLGSDGVCAGGCSDGPTLVAVGP